jgi:hypothetical protein
MSFAIWRRGNPPNQTLALSEQNPASGAILRRVKSNLTVEPKFRMDHW